MPSGDVQVEIIRTQAGFLLLAGVRRLRGYIGREVDPLWLRKELFKLLWCPRKESAGV